MLFDHSRGKKTLASHMSESLDAGPGVGVKKKIQGGGGPPKGARLFNCCQFPLKTIHHEDWVKQSHQHTKGILPSMLVFVSTRPQGCRT